MTQEESKSIFALFDNASLHLRPLQRVIKKNDYEQFLSTQELCQRAQEEIEIAHQKLRKEMQLNTEKAQQQGFDEGMAFWVSGVQQYQESLHRLGEELKRLFVPLVMQCVKNIIQGEFKQDENAILSIINQALTMVIHHKVVTISVHPNELKKVERMQERFKVNALQTLILQPDSNVKEGGCVIMTEEGVVDAQLDTLLGSMEMILKKNQENLSPPFERTVDSHLDQFQKEVGEPPQQPTFSPSLVPPFVPPNKDPSTIDQKDTPSKEISDGTLGKTVPNEGLPSTVAQTVAQTTTQENTLFEGISNNILEESIPVDAANKEPPLSVSPTSQEDLTSSLVDDSSDLPASELLTPRTLWENNFDDQYNSDPRDNLKEDAL